MRNLIFFVLTLLTTTCFAQVEALSDTSEAPGRADKTRIGVVGGLPYLKGATGNATPILTHAHLYQYFYTGGDTGAQYFLISTSTMANSNGALFDAFQISATVGGWNGDNREIIDLYIASRATFSYNWLTRGTHQTTDGIVVYQNANNTFSIYGVLTGNFKFGTVSVQLNNQWKQLPTNLNGTKSATTPSGTLVFDSRNTATYPPVSTGGGSASWGDITGTLPSQTDLNTALSNKSDKFLTINQQTGSTYTLVASDCWKMLEFTQACTVTIPNSTLAAGCLVTWSQVGTGQVTFTAGSGVTMTSFQGYTKSGGQWALGNLYFRTTSAFVLGGQISN